MGEITSNMQNIHSIFVEKNYKLYIPVFQREFVWNSDVAEQLINDFREDSNNYSIDSSQLPGYLLGNIVLIKPNDATPYYSVVDGQQRLISLTLLAKALYDRLLIKISESAIDIPVMKSWVKVQSDIDKVYSILDDENEWQGHRIIFNEFLQYGNFYSELLKMDSEKIDDLEVSGTPQNNIREVYLKFKYMIFDLTDSQLVKFTNYFKKNIKLIITVAPSEEKAFQLFEVLNSRGRTLEPLDLIKNIFLQKIYEDQQPDDEKNRFNSHWGEFSNNLEISKNKVISSSTFLKQYIIARYGKNIRKDELYTFMKNTGFNSSEILDLTKDLKQISNIYRDIEKKDYRTFIENTSGNISIPQKETLRTKISIIFDIFGVSQFHSLLIPFYFDTFEKKNRILDGAIKYGAAVLFAQRQTNVIENEIETFLHKYINAVNEGSKFEDLIVEINNKRDNYIREFQNTLYMVNYGNRKQKALTLLKFVELYGNANNNVLHAPKTGINSITLEHIMPQTPSGDISENNIEDINLYNLYVNNIGNLTLLKKSDNSGVQNISFANKKETYKSSQYTITSNIIEPLPNNRTTGQDHDQVRYNNVWNPQYTQLIGENGSLVAISDHWTKEAIIARGKKLTEYIVELLH